MSLPEKLGWTVYAGLLGTATTIAATKVVEKAWESITGEEPPEPNDPETPASVAVTWAVVSGLGIAMSQMFINRFAARRWRVQMGHKEPGQRKTYLKV